VSAGIWHRGLEKTRVIVLPGGYAPEKSAGEPDSVVKEYLTVQKEGDREVSRTVKHYNLDVIPG
jgi:hypothetical protein